VLQEVWYLRENAGIADAFGVIKQKAARIRTKPGTRNRKLIGRIASPLTTQRRFDNTTPASRNQAQENRSLFKTPRTRLTSLGMLARVQLLSNSPHEILLGDSQMRQFTHLLGAMALLEFELDVAGPKPGLADH